MDSPEFKNLVLPMSKKLYHFARLLLKDDVGAEDAVQEVFLKLWNMRNRLEAYNNLEAFAMRITKNYCLDCLKLKKPKYVDHYHGNMEMHTEQNNPLDLLERHDMIELFNKSLEKLPEQQKMVFQMRDIEGFDYDEIAEVMETNKNAVRVSLSRARKSLREELIKIKVYG